MTIQQPKAVKRRLRLPRTKYLFRRDTLLATISVSTVMWLLSLIPINAHVLNFLYVATADVDYNDLAYKEYRNTPERRSSVKADTGIVLVDIGGASRAGIAQVIEQVRLDGARAIGVDVLFAGPKEDITGDNSLRTAIAATPNLVLAQSIVGSETDAPELLGYFRESAAHNGAINFVTEDSIATVRKFAPFAKVSGKADTAFAAAIVHVSDPGRFARLVKRHRHATHPLEWIAYRRDADGYFHLTAKELLDTSRQAQWRDALNNKIVLIGDLSPDPNRIEDKFYTPLNERFAGKAKPDMSGMLIHANIITMLREGNYVHETPHWLAYFIAFLICWLHMSVFIRYYIDRHIWFHLVAKVAQILSAIFIIFVGIGALRLGIKLRLEPTLIAIVLAVDVLYFYEALAKWLQRKINFRTAFSDKLHHP